MTTMDTTDLTIRRAVQADIPAIAVLLHQVNDVHADGRPDLFERGARKYDDRQLARILDDPTGHPVFVAERGGAVTGYAFCQREDFTGPGSNMTDHVTLYIDDICVDEHSRGMHIGTALYRHVLDYARATGCHNVTLNAWACNPGAVKFYESLGMRVYKYGMEQVL